MHEAQLSVSLSSQLGQMFVYLEHEIFLSKDFKS